MFNKLTLEGLRGVGRVELDFQPGSRVRTLFGANGVGKTKCLEAIYQWLLLTNACFGERSLTAEHVVMKSLLVQEAASDEGIHLDFSSGVTLIVGNLPVLRHSQPVLLLGAHGRSDLCAGPASSTVLGTFEQRRRQYLDHIWGQMARGERLGAGMSTNVQHWFVQRAQSVNPYQKDADNRRLEIDAVLDMLHAVDDRIDAHTLQIDGAGRVFLQVEGQLRGLDELSSGFASLVRLMQAIVAAYASFTNEPQLRHVSGVVLIDEIESHLHASWQTRIIPTLKTLLPNTTFYVATHSPLVLSQLEEGEAYVLKRDADGVVRTQVIDSPNRRAFVDVLNDTLEVDLNGLKRAAMPGSDQRQAKQQLLDLLTSTPGGQA